MQLNKHAYSTATMPDCAMIFKTGVVYLRLFRRLNSVKLQNFGGLGHVAYHKHSATTPLYRKQNIIHVDICLALIIE